MVQARESKALGYSRNAFGARKRERFGSLEISEASLHGSEKANKFSNKKVVNQRSTFDQSYVIRFIAERAEGFGIVPGPPCSSTGSLSKSSNSNASRVLQNARMAHGEKMVSAGTRLKGVKHRP